MAKLTWVSADGVQTRELADITSIGRSRENDLLLRDPLVSKLHARILRDGNDWVLEDTGSRNGSLVNGVRQTRCLLRHGDRIQIGPNELRFECGDAAPFAQPAGVDQSDIDSFLEWDNSTVAGVRESDNDIVPTHTIDVTSVAGLPEVTSPATDRLTLRLKASYAISKAAAATLNLAVILDRVLEALFEIFASAERAVVMLVDADSGKVRRGAVKFRRSLDDTDVHISRTALRQVLSRREALLCVDTALDDRFAAVQSIADYGIRSMMIAPLLFKGQMHGAILIDTLNRTAPFTQDDLELLSFAGTEVAACLTNADLHRKALAAEHLAAVGRTVAGLSHCMKNILQGIKGGAYIVEKGLADKTIDRIRQGWNMVKHKNDFMEELVWDLLNLSKARAPDYELTDLNALCTEIVEIGAGKARNSDVEVNFVADKALKNICVDPKGIRRCILNLVTNAVDACLEGGGDVEVRTFAAEADGMVRVVVRDTGCGMSEETLAKLFTIFFSTKGSKGTGLGLPVTKKIVEEHGGRIKAESRQGDGTTFTVSLPATRLQRPKKGASHAGGSQEDTDSG